MIFVILIAREKWVLLSILKTKGKKRKYITAKSVQETPSHSLYLSLSPFEILSHPIRFDLFFHHLMFPRKIVTVMLLL